MSKKAIRTDYLARRRQLSHRTRDFLSQQICHRITHAEWFSVANTLFAYMPFRQEVNIKPVLEVSWRQGKTVFLPKVDRDAKTMALHRVASFDDLSPGAHGILEPLTDRARLGDLALLDVCLVPGVVFDRVGYRIGYGGGYYDRFLPQLTDRTVCMGVGFSLQVTDPLPVEEHDTRLDGLVTEQGTLWFPG